MMSLLARPTPSKSTDFTIHVYCRDKKKWLTQMYCIKTKDVILYTTKTHKFNLLFCSGMFTTDGSSRQRFCPDIYNYFGGKILTVRCG